MTHTLTERLQTVRVTDGQGSGGLQVFGLSWTNGKPLNYLTLDEALAGKALEVTEVSEGGSVPILKVVNKGEAMVFMMAGEQLVGAKQNRVLNVSILMPGKSDLPIPVSCVEAGRWHYRSPQFGSGGMSHGSLRKLMAGHAHASYKAGGWPASKQAEVWGEVARKLTEVGTTSPSQALHQAYEDHCGRLADVLAGLRVPEGCCGAAFALAGRIAGADLFDQPATLAKLWPKLVPGYALDALQKAGTEPVTAEAVREWLGRAPQATAEPFKSPGLGYDVRLEGAGLVGGGLVVDDQPVHVELFAHGAHPTP
jgi:hypothetical protein